MDHEDRLKDLERRHHRLTIQSRIQFGVIAVMAAGLLAGFAARDGGVLRVSELVVVDPQGVERVRIGGDLPDAVVDGRTLVRGEAAAGVLLYDAAGHERGGYVTMEPSGNVMLTLDDRRSRMKALFVAGGENGAALRIGDGGGSLDMRSDADGARMTIVDGGQVAVQTPVIAMGPEPCSAYRGALETLSHERVIQECRSRFTAEACHVCLEG